MENIYIYIYFKKNEKNEKYIVISLGSTSTDILKMKNVAIFSPGYMALQLLNSLD